MTVNLYTLVYSVTIYMQYYSVKKYQVSNNDKINAGYFMDENFGYLYTQKVFGVTYCLYIYPQLLSYLCFILIIVQFSVQWQPNIVF